MFPKILIVGFKNFNDNFRIYVNSNRYTNLIKYLNKRFRGEDFDRAHDSGQTYYKIDLNFDIY